MIQKEQKNKIWVYEELDICAIDNLSKKAKISNFLARIFLHRGISDINYIHDFLNPSLENLNDPFLFNDMDRAVERIVKAIVQREKIIIFGDYDVDGITSTSTMYRFLFEQKANVEYYIPNRMEEGYGLSKVAIDKVIKLGAQLIITVDSGITAIDEVKYINDNGIEVIITDHHECKETLPEAYAVISPSRNDSTYPFKELAGVGVVYKVIHAICIKLNLGQKHNEYIDLVALGTVADVVPLVGENRIIVKYGILKMENTLNVGLRTLMENCGQKEKSISSWTISFIYAPRVNAAGRIGDAGRGVKLFTTEDIAEALSLVTEFNEDNKYRQDTEAEIIREAITQIEEDPNFEKEKILVVSHEGWHHGIIGIVASKVSERYYKPCIILSIENGIAKGSGRSFEGFDLFKALSYCTDELEKFGGHEFAAGLSLKIEKLQAFRTKINDYADQNMAPEDLIPKIKIDLDINKDDVNMDNIRDLNSLAPFGAGNPFPLFGYRGIKIADIRTVGENKHIKLKLEDEGFLVDAIGFNLGDRANIFSNSDFLDIACSLETNTWNSVEKIQLNLKEMKASEYILLEEQYYSSLNKCLSLKELSIKGNDSNIANNINKITSHAKFFDLITDSITNKKRVKIFINCLTSIKILQKKLMNSPQHIKKQLKVCYTCFSNDTNDIIDITVNPIPDELAVSNIDRVIFYGPWLTEKHFDRLLSKVKGCELYSFLDLEGTKLNFEEIIPQRSELETVYRYIKAKKSGNNFSENIKVLIKKIASETNLKLNYFKINKIIEIFEELKLFNMKHLEETKVNIEILENRKEKTNLENSVLYTTLQEIGRAKI